MLGARHGWVTPKGLGGFEYLLVAIDKFTNWIEVFPMVMHIAEKAVNFIKDITYWFSVMNRILTDLASTFIGEVFWDYCENSGIEVYYTSVAHPRERPRALLSNRRSSPSRDPESEGLAQTEVSMGRSFPRLQRR